jgi:hypothetical protein
MEFKPEGMFSELWDTFEKGHGDSDSQISTIGSLIRENLKIVSLSLKVRYIISTNINYLIRVLRK